MDSLIAINIDTRELEAMIRRVAVFADKEALDIAATETINAIDKKSLSGVSPKGEYLGGYISRHKQRRERAGLQTDHVDLHFSGEFMGSLYRDGNTVTVPSGKQGHAEGLHNRYGIMDVGSDTVDAMEHEIAKGLDRTI